MREQVREVTLNSWIQSCIGLPSNTTRMTLGLEAESGEVIAGAASYMHA